MSKSAPAQRSTPDRGSGSNGPESAFQQGASVQRLEIIGLMQKTRKPTYNAERRWIAQSLGSVWRGRAQAHVSISCQQTVTFQALKCTFGSIATGTPHRTDVGLTGCGVPGDLSLIQINACHPRRAQYHLAGSSNGPASCVVRWAEGHPILRPFAYSPRNAALSRAGTISVSPLPSVTLTAGSPSHQFLEQRVGCIVTSLDLLRRQIGRVAKPPPRPSHGDDGRLPVIVGWVCSCLIPG
jgi:hypothetical protein